MHVQFNNKKQVSTWGLFLTLLFLIALGLLGGYYLIMEDRQQSVELALWGFLLLSVLVFYFGGFCYVEVDLSEQKLDVKYYRLFPIGRQYKRILLPVEKLRKIKVAKGFLGVGQRLIIEGSIKGRYALFPSVGLAACTKKQAEELMLYVESIGKAK